jgi:hypothetical protein
MLLDGLLSEDGTSLGPAVYLWDGCQLLQPAALHQHSVPDEPIL